MGGACGGGGDGAGPVVERVMGGACGGGGDGAGPVVEEVMGQGLW